MKKSRALLFNILFQVVISLLILDFTFNPLPLSPSCLTAHASSSDLGSGSIIDCIACHSFSEREVGEQFIGHVKILVPMSENQPSGLDQRLSFDSTQMKRSKIHEEFIYDAHVLIQRGCAEYECKAFHSLEDFSLRSKENQQLLNQYNLEHSDLTFQISNDSLSGLNLPLGLDFTRQKIVLVSNELNQKDVSSLVARTRYSVNSKIQGERMPAILVHGLRTDIYVRLILVLVVMLQFGRIMALLSHYTSCVKMFLFLILVSGFLSTATAVIASSLAIYLTLSKLMQIRTYGLVTPVVFLLFAYLTLYRGYPLTYSSLFVIIYSLILCFKELKDHFGLIELGTLGGLLGSLIFMSVHHWHFYIFLAPLLLLSTLLSIREEKDSQKTAKYDLINFNDEEQDVLSKIERELR